MTALSAVAAELFVRTENDKLAVELFFAEE